MRTYDKYVIDYTRSCGRLAMVLCKTLEEVREWMLENGYTLGTPGRYTTFCEVTHIDGAELNLAERAVLTQPAVFRCGRSHARAA
jgi:hypothetical protein